MIVLLRLLPAANTSFRLLAISLSKQFRFVAQSAFRILVSLLYLALGRYKFRFFYLFVAFVRTLFGYGFLRGIRQNNCSLLLKRFRFVTGNTIQGLHCIAQRG